MGDNRASEGKATGAPVAATEAAPAKINLALHLTGRRADGYHTIETLAVFTAHGDTLGAEPAEGDTTTLAVSGPFADALSGTPAAGNLALRAVAALAASAGHRRRGVRLDLTKNIPVAAGLGGGSADAAAALRLMNRLWGAGFDAAQLAALALPLGADVPMCLVSRPLVASGIGEAIAPVGGLPALPVVLVHPGVAVSTAAVFAARSGAFGSPLPPLPPRFADAAAVALWLQATRNDLAAPASRIAPAAADAAAALSGDRNCLLARMSGSGAAAFGIFPTPAEAERGAARIRNERPGWWAIATVTGGAERASLWP